MSHLTSHLDGLALGEEVQAPGASLLPMGTTSAPLVPAPLPASGGKVNAAIAVGISALVVYLILSRLGK